MARTFGRSLKTLSRRCCTNINGMAEDGRDVQQKVEGTILIPVIGRVQELNSW
jgi:hypothetical protein